MLIINKLFACKYKDGGREFPYLDCYGFVKYIYKKEQGIDIPDFEYRKAEAKNNEKLYYLSITEKSWKEVLPQKGSVIALRVNGYISHMGYMLNREEFIHIMDKKGVMISKVTSLQWKNRVVGYYKYD